MMKTENRGLLGLLAVAALVAGSATWVACGSDGGSSGGPPGPPPPPLPTTTVGWTEFTESVDTLKVYVSNSAGSNTNDGLSEALPKKTISAGAALMRDGMPDWLLLKAGDTWTNEDLGNWTKSGRSTTEPMLISSYGTGARPHIRTGTEDGMDFFGGSPVDHVAVVGLHFEAHTFTGSQGSTGIRFLVPGDDILIEDCLIQGYSDNMAVQGAITNFRLRRCVIVDAYSTASHSQGIYAEGINGLLVEECVFDHNGWNESVGGAEETIFNHNVYVQSDCLNVTVRGNIIARGSSHGLQLRPGGTAENNLFLRNGIAMFAAGEDAGPPLTSVIDNVVLDGKDIDSSPRASGIQIFDSRNALVRNNIVAQKPPGVGNDEAFSVRGFQDDDPNVDYEIVFEDNIAFQWNGPGLQMQDTYTALTVRNNIFQDLANSNSMIEVSDIQGFEVFEDNTYFSNLAVGSWFRIGGSVMNLANWVSGSSETGAQALQVVFPDANRTIATYQTSLGRTPTLDAFLSEARQQTKSLFRPDYTADVVNDYIRAGFGR